MSDEPLPASIATSPVGRRLSFVLGHLRTGAGGLTDADIQVNFVTEEMSVDRFRETLSRLGELLGDFGLRGVRSPDGQVAVAVVANADRAWHVGVRIEKSPPHRIRNVVRSDLKPGLAVRLATEADAHALRSIEFESPIVLGSTRVVYDRGEDYFAAERLMGDVVTHVVEREGIPVGLQSTVINPLLVNGTILRGIYAHRLRVLPDARGMGGLLGFASFEANSWRADIPYAFIAAGNEAALRNAPKGGSGEWSVHPERVVIDTKQEAGSPSGRPCTPADSQRIISLLNSAHGQAELYIDHTTDTLAARLERQPNLYSWQHLRLGQRAVVGVWPAHLNVIRESEGATEKDDRALVLDYGYEAGAEDELVALIRAACADLAQSGATELTIFTSLPSSVHAPLTALGKRIEPYVLALYIPEPPDLASRGVYVDQLYF